MSAHTPGPWHTAGERGEFVNDSRQMNICRINSTVSWSGAKSVSDGPTSHEANARLIAAAPAMLEALTAALSEFESVSRNTNRGYGYGQAVCVSSQTREQVKAAIRQAKGEL